MTKAKGGVILRIESLIKELKEEYEDKLYEVTLQDKLNDTRRKKVESIKNELDELKSIVELIKQ